MKAYLALKAILIIMLFLISCQSTKRKGIGIIIENAEVQSLNKLLLDEYFDGSHAYGEKKKNMAKNTLKYKIINHTAETQLLVFDPYNKLTGNLRPAIYDKTGKKRIINSFMYTPVEDSAYVANVVFLADVVRYEIKKYNDFEIPDVYRFRNYDRYAIILQPGEERSFVSVIYLPLVDEGSEGNLSLYRDIVGGDTFGLIYYAADRKRYIESLPEWELENLKRQKVNWYSDTIYSNRVPVRIVE